MEHQPLEELENIDQNKYTSTHEIDRIVEVSLQAGAYVMALAGVPRVPVYRYENGVRKEITEGTIREDDAQHTLMLTTVSLALMEEPTLHEYFGHLDKLRVVKECIVHDAAEIFTGDQQTYSASELDLARKEKAEKKAKEGLVKVMPSDLYESLETYEEQESKESRFVRHLDKLMPLIVDYIGKGSDVIRYDYKVQNIAEHKKHEENHRERVQGLFPESDWGHLALHAAWEILAEMVSDELEESFKQDIIDTIEDAA